MSWGRNIAKKKFLKKPCKARVLTAAAENDWHWELHILGDRHTPKNQGRLDQRHIGCKHAMRNIMIFFPPPRRSCASQCSPILSTGAGRGQWTWVHQASRWRGQGWGRSVLGVTWWGRNQSKKFRSEGVRWSLKHPCLSFFHLNRAWVSFYLNHRVRRSCSRPSLTFWERHMRDFLTL